jgi:hypothetical protein
MKTTVYRGLTILICCLGLFSLDRETHRIQDLFSPGNILALFLYFIPTYLFCYLTYKVCIKWRWKDPFVWSLILGIPGGFGIVVVLLMLKMGRL